MEQGGASSGMTSISGASEPLDWQFLQCFGERTPGEEIQEGRSFIIGVVPKTWIIPYNLTARIGLIFSRNCDRP